MNSDVEEWILHKWRENRESTIINIDGWSGEALLAVEAIQTFLKEMDAIDKEFNEAGEEE